MTKKSAFLALALIFLAAAAAKAEEQGAGASFEEIFMGLQAPFPKRQPAPGAGSTPTETVKALYANSVYFHLRNDFPKEITDYLSPCFSGGLVSHFEASREKVEKWFELHANEQLKLPLGEGSVFTGSYEGATRYTIGESVIHNDKARVKIYLTFVEGDYKFGWHDTALLVRADDRWLLEDIIFDPRESTGLYSEDARVESTLRKKVMIDEGS